VATPSGDVPIESLRVGDRVQSFDLEAGLPTTTRVRSIQAAHAEKLLAFGALQVTANHPVYADGRWLVAGDIEKGAELLSRTGPVLAEPRRVSRAAVVFDLSVGPPHSYFAGGVLVHNKAAHVPIGPDNAPFGGWFFRRAAQGSASKPRP
jgi:hypothetical protein